MLCNRFPKFCFDQGSHPSRLYSGLGIRSLLLSASRGHETANTILYARLRLRKTAYDICNPKMPAPHPAMKSKADQEAGAAGDVPHGSLTQARLVHLGNALAQVPCPLILLGRVPESSLAGWRD
jgi:hypothetical protein